MSRVKPSRATYELRYNHDRVTRRSVPSRFRSSSAPSCSSASPASLLFLYLILHLAGNLLVFLGPDIFNEYSHTLISNPLIVPIEIGLLLIFLLHIYKTIRMYLANQAARPVGYAKKKPAGRTSRKSARVVDDDLSGLWLLIFVVIHVKRSSSAPSTEMAGAAVRDLYRTRDRELQPARLASRST